MNNEQIKPTETTGRYYEVRFSSYKNAHYSTLIAEVLTFAEADARAKQIHSEGQRNVFVRPPTR